MINRKKKLNFLKIANISQLLITVANKWKNPLKNAIKLR